MTRIDFEQRDPAFNKEYRMLSFVPRWGIAPRLTEQSVAEHCYFVALYASQLCDYFNLPSDETRLILGWALRHDAPEVWTSDPPGPAKRFYIDADKLRAYIDEFGLEVPDFAAYRAVFTDPDVAEQVKNHIVAIIKIADLIDECMYLRIEIEMGNNMVRDLYRFSLAGLEERLAEWGEEAQEYVLSSVMRQLNRIAAEGAVIRPLKREGDAV